MLYIILAAMMLVMVFLCYCISRAFLTYGGSLGKYAALLTIFLLIIFSFAFHPVEMFMGLSFPPFLSWIMDLLFMFFIILFPLYVAKPILSKIDVYPVSLRRRPLKELGIFSAISVFCIVLGVVNNFIPFVVQHEIVTTKAIGINRINIALISDLHIGSQSMNTLKLTMIINKINATNPDIILIAGDIFDRNATVQDFKDGGYGELLSELRPTYGTFAVTGEGDYGGKNIKEIADVLSKAKIALLQDRVVYFERLNMLLVGRKDISVNSEGGWRKPLSDVFGTIPKNVQNKEPLIIVLDHNPNSVDDTLALFGDIQFSGHTHNGQIFPLNLLSYFFYEQMKGLKVYATTSLFVSPGVGLKGVPVRTSSLTEIDNIIITRVN